MDAKSKQTKASIQKRSKNMNTQSKTIAAGQWFTDDTSEKWIKRQKLVEISC